MAHKRQQRRRTVLLISGVIVVAYIVWSLLRPLPKLQPVYASTTIHAATASSALVWPESTQSAVGIVGSDILDRHATQTPLPTASTAKVIAALAVLRQHPLTPGEAGPMITLSPADVTIYNSYTSRGGSVVPVIASEQISEYQALQAMMLPSANNMADSLAIWAFGSLSSYANYANQFVKQLGMTKTQVGIDASGFDPSTTSTASDLVKLGEAAMQNPALAQIVGQRSATDIPQSPNVTNVNSLLGRDNIIGVKTGNTDQAGGVYISASKTTAGGSPLVIVTALIGAPNLFAALNSSLPLVTSAQHNIVTSTIATKGSIVGSYSLPWGGRIIATPKTNFNVEAWKGSDLSATVHLHKISATSTSGQTIGNINLSQSSLTGPQSLAVVQLNSPSKPPLWWRLLHPYP